jgi:hypothetical protein
VIDITGQMCWRDEMAVLDPSGHLEPSMNFLRTCVGFRGRLNRVQYIVLSLATLLPLALVALLEKASDNSGPAMVVALAVVSSPCGSRWPRW